jgi:hypothetical protein
MAPDVALLLFPDRRGITERSSREGVLMEYSEFAKCVLFLWRNGLPGS